MTSSLFFDLSNQTALVTGAADGIGAAIAKRLAMAGAMVGIADIDLDQAQRTAGEISSASGCKTFPIRMDVSNRQEVESAVEFLLSQTGRLDILVNNAGIGGRAAPLWEQTDEDWSKVLAINLTGVFLCCRAVIQHMRSKRYGRIVNIASIAGKEGNPRMTGYSATKAAVIGFTKSLAKEVATEGICVNAVSPAVVKTRILDQLTPEQVDYMTSRIPMRRPGLTEEIAAVVHFLASPDCSFVTGQCYDASGGRATY
ncbi:MAG TPA: SDR family NAD(P)-dependent oxidoreductase [Bryobacteraceae bacterium]|jgi:3-oxoacyl-[acyl-carrier protein] reductase